MVSSAYLRLLIFLLAILIPACASSSPVFLMMYSAYKLNKQGDNVQPWCIPFPIWNQCVVPCPVLTVVSWPACRFLKRQVRWSDIRISFRIFHRLLWSTQSKALVPLNFSFFSIIGWGIGLDYHDIEWFALEQRSFCHFLDFIHLLHFRLFCWPWWLLHFF